MSLLLPNRSLHRGAQAGRVAVRTLEIGDRQAFRKKGACPLFPR